MQNKKPLTPSFGNIKNIKGYGGSSIGSRNYYFFDTNVWIYILNPERKKKIAGPYLNFWASLVGIYHRKEKTEFNPKVIMTSVLFSEILHAQIQKIMLPDYLKEEWKNNQVYWEAQYYMAKKNANRKFKANSHVDFNKFKNWFIQSTLIKNEGNFYGFMHYKKTDHFKNALNNLNTRFAQVSKFTEVGKHISFDYKTMVDIISKFSNGGIDTNAGVNDYYFYYYCRKLGIPLVTNDQDFACRDLKIITANEKLLTLKG